MNRRKICGYKYSIVLVMLLLKVAIASGQVITQHKPIAVPNRTLMFKKAQSLDKGMNISWLEQTWKKDILNDTTIAESDFALLKKLGFKTIRLPVAFTHFEKHQVPLDSVLTRITWVLNNCKKYGFNLIVCYHYGNLTNDNYMTETPVIIDLWQKVAKTYISESSNQLYFEVYNEPTVSDQVWKDAAYNIVQGIRKVDKKRTLLLGASNYNSIYEMSRFVRLADENIIYSFHFYEPFFFTHQGAEWIGDQVSTTGVPFPYLEERYPQLNPKAKNTWGETNYYNYRTDGNERSLTDKLSAYVVPWSKKYGVPVICTEYGAYKKYADAYSRCRYIKAMCATLKTLGISGVMWDYNGNFSIFDGKPSIDNLSQCMRDAIGYTN